MNEVISGGRSSSGAVGSALHVLMARYGIGVQDAFELLLRGARRAGLDLRDMATGIVRADQRADARSGPRTRRVAPCPPAVVRTRPAG